MIHAGGAFDDTALCGDADGERSIYARKVTCTACVASRERNAEFGRYRTDRELCRAVLAMFAERNGRIWSVA